MQCIGTLIQMKAQITNLVRFFSALSAMVEHVVKQNITDFIQQVQTAKEVLIANVSLLDVSRQVRLLQPPLFLYSQQIICPGIVYNNSDVPSVLLPLLHHRQDVYQNFH
jgi:hypothetical protein